MQKSNYCYCADEWSRKISKTDVNNMGKDFGWKHFFSSFKEAKDFLLNKLKIKLQNVNERAIELQREIRKIENITIKDVNYAGQD